jgi:hypothetical protein
VDLFVCYLIYEKRHSSKCWVGFACVAIRFRGGPILPWSFVWCMFMWYLFYQRIWLKNFICSYVSTCMHSN